MTPLTQARSALERDLSQLLAFVKEGKECSEYLELWIRHMDHYGDLRVEEYRAKAEQTRLGGCADVY